MSDIVNPNYDESVDFLRRWGPGPWTLTAVDPEEDDKSLPTKTFGDLADVRSWLENYGKRYNIYFTVNPLMHAMAKKPSRDDVAALAWLHVDVDPRVGEELSSEHARIRALFENPPAGIPAPTVVVFSGGGYQGFWRLEESFKIDGKPELYEEATLWNKQLEVLFDADSCHNVDRIMRLPGTINRPNAKKRKKGRVEALASVAWWSDASYPLASFVKAPQVQDNGGFNGHTVTVSGNIRRIVNLDELPEGVKDSTKVVIAQGQDPDNPDRFGGSRSEWLFLVCCDLVRAGCDNDTIYSIITDPGWAISKSVLDKHGRSEKYALRQIKRARDHAIDPLLMELNEKHAVIGSVGGKCRIISEEADPVLGRSSLTFQSAEDFKLRYSNRRIETPTGNGKVVSTPLGQWWLGHPNRQQFETIVFAPGMDVPSCYNLWRGFAYEMRPGDCSLYLAHVRQVICGGNDQYYNYLLDWMALAVQKPAQPGHTAIVLRGRQGTGKGFFINTFGKLFGRHFLQVSDPKKLTGSFNAHLRDCVILFGDEAFFAGDKKHESVLKTMITEELSAVEAKGVDIRAGANYIHLMMASNSDWVVPAGHDERRFFVLDVGRDHMQDYAYFKDMKKQLETGGYEALLYMLMTRDVSEFDARSMPRTEALMDQKIHSFTPDQEWWYQKLMNGEIVDGEGWPTFITGLQLTTDFTEYMRQWGHSARSNATRLGHFMQSVCPEGHRVRGQLSGKHEVTVGGRTVTVNRPRVYMLPTLDECREHWDAYFGGPYNWKEPTVVEQPEPAEIPF